MFYVVAPPRQTEIFYNEDQGRARLSTLSSNKASQTAQAVLQAMAR